MRDKGKKTLRSWGQNLTIFLLSISALWLLNAAQLYPTGELGGVFALLNHEESPSTQSTEGWGQGSTLRPARMALLGEMGCYGVQYDDEAVAELFAQVVNPLVDVLAGAGTPRQASQREWELALSGGQMGVYFDFLGQIPLEGLYAWSSGGRSLAAGLQGDVRQLICSVTSQGYTRLYYFNETDGLYYACDSTARVAERLEPLMEGVAPNGQFAFQNAQYHDLASHTFLGFLPPKPLVYTSQNPLPLTEEGGEGLRAFAQTLDFHPQSYTTYAVPDGLTIREGGDTLTVSRDGEVSFRAAEDEQHRYPVAGEGVALNTWEAVDGAWAFVDTVLTPQCGDARLYLMDWQEDEEGVSVYFGYLLNGAMVQLGGEGYAAKVVVREGHIDSFSLNLRSYRATEETTLVLQEARAVTAMTPLGVEGSELILCYLDGGGDTVNAGWIARS